MFNKKIHPLYRLEDIETPFGFCKPIQITYGALSKFILPLTFFLILIILWFFWFTNYEQSILHETKHLLFQDELKTQREWKIANQQHAQLREDFETALKQQKQGAGEVWGVVNATRGEIAGERKVVDKIRSDLNGEMKNETENYQNITAQLSNQSSQLNHTLPQSALKNLSSQISANQRHLQRLHETYQSELKKEEAKVLILHNITANLTPKITLLNQTLQNLTLNQSKQSRKLHTLQHKMNAHAKSNSGEMEVVKREVADLKGNLSEFESSKDEKGGLGFEMYNFAEIQQN